jgi:hypothetical protein
MPCKAVRVLENSATSALRVLVAGGIILLSPLAALAGNTSNHPGFAGIYLSRLAKTAPSMGVSLGEDGTATVTQDPGKGSTTLFGHWVDDGNQIKVTFNADEGAPPEPPMVFQPSHSGLQAVTWNHQVWGNVTPPVMQKGYKVKYKFWLSTMP